MCDLCSESAVRTWSLDKVDKVRFLFAAARDVAFTVDEGGLRGGFEVPEGDLAVECGDGDLCGVGAVDDGKDVGGLGEGFRGLRAREYGPDADGTVPGA